MPATTYLDAYDRFVTFAHNTFGGESASPHLNGGAAASVLRYAKNRIASLPNMLRSPFDSEWLATFGPVIARTPVTAIVPVESTDQMWRWLHKLCEALDRLKVPMVAVTPNPAADHAALARLLLPSDGGGGRTSPVDDPSQVPDDEADASGWRNPAIPPGRQAGDKPTTGETLNRALFFIAAIFLVANLRR